MKQFLIIAINIFICSTAFGQDSIPLPNQSTKVVKQFQPKIENAKPVYISPKKRIEENLPNLNLSYNTPAQVFTIAYPDPVIKPLVFEEEEDAKNLRDGYVKLGYGNNRSPLIESQFHYDIQDWLQTGLSIRHYSAQDSTADVFRSYSRTLGEFYATYFLTDQTKVTADIHYQNDNRNLCCSGIKEFDLQPSIQLDNYGFGLRIDHNSFSVKGFSTKHNLEANRVNSKLNEESEYHFGYSSTTNKTLGDKLLFNLPLGFDYYTSDIWTEDPYQIQGRPNLFYKTVKFSVRAGAFLASNDSLFVRPHVEISYLLPWHDLEAVGSYEANSSINSLHRFYSEMPYFNYLGDEQTSFAVEEIGRLGVRYKTKKANIYLGGLYGQFNNQVLYNYEELGQHSFGIYDYDGFGMELNGSYKFDKILSIHTNLFFHDFTPDFGDLVESDVKRYYIPQLEADLRLEQLFFEKLKVYETLRYLSTRDVNIKDDIGYSLTQIDSYVDLGIGLEYLHKNFIGIFAEANNLLNNSYEHFYLDNSFKLNYHLGIKFLF